MIRKPKPEKKDGLGVFAKILAGLLRKAGEKDAPSLSGADKGAHGVKDSASGAPEELSALFPGGAGWAKGKKAGNTGTPGPESAEGNRAVKAKKNGPAGKPGEKTGAPGEDEQGAFGGPLPFTRPETAAAGLETAEAGMDGKTAAAKGLAWERLALGDEAPDEPALAFFPAPEGFNAGLPAGAGAEGEPAAGEVRAVRKGKAGEKTQGPGFPEGGSGGGRYAQELQASAMKKTGLPEGGKEGGRPAESRYRDKRRDRVNLEVRDFRAGEDRRPGSPAGTYAAQNAAGEARSGGGSGETEIVLELRGDRPGGEAPDSAYNSRENRSAQSFEHILARELHENLNGDIVRHASMVLRDNGQGTIRLSLKPESLGNVKIRLEMAENKITGHIVVESEEALRAFEREVHSLEQAFRDSGFDGAELDMSLAQDGGGADRRWNGEETGRPFLSGRMAASQYDAAPEHAEYPGLPAAEARNGMYTRNGRIAVNMLV
jgi:hypothetical protein